MTDKPTPEAALYQFLAGFGLPVYAATATPDEGDDEWAGFPYMTYDLVVGGWDGGEVNVPVNLWYRGDSEAAPNAKVREMAEGIGLGGLTIPCQGGFIWVKKGSPWAQAVRVEGEDEKVKRRYVNINVEYLVHA